MSEMTAEELAAVRARANEPYPASTDYHAAFLAARRDVVALLATIDADRARLAALLALLARVRPRIGRCGLDDGGPCYRWDSTTALEDEVDAALASQEATP